MIIVYTGHEKISTAQLFERLNSDMINGFKLSTGGKLVVSHLLNEIKGRRKCNSYRHRESLAVMNDVYMIRKKAWLIYHVLGPLVISFRYYFAKYLFSSSEHLPIIWRRSNARRHSS